jgi:hypothetical protein
VVTTSPRFLIADSHGGGEHGSRDAGPLGGRTFEGTEEG